MTMPLVEDAKKVLESVTGYRRPSSEEISVQKMRPESHSFEDDGETPNNSRFPLLLYRSVVTLSPDYDPAATFEELFKANGWAGSWRDSIYPYNHFHTGTHEVLGIARGTARVQFGGAAGDAIELAAGDVIVIPAGTGHCALEKSDNLLVVGAYPRECEGAYDEPRPCEADPTDARASIAAVEAPPRDPVYGAGGPLREIWWRRHNGHR
jgi:uncharacterized protein YjlB